MPMAFNLFCNQVGDGFTVMPEIVTPQYLGAKKTFLNLGHQF